MLVPNQMVEVHWCPPNRKHYESKGYIFTKYRQPLMVKAEDLMQTSTIKVRVICDYCGKEFTTQYKLYVKGMETIPKTSCNKCWHKKAEEINMKKYGTPYPAQREEVKEKIRATSLEKYGVENPAMTKEVKEKIKATNLERYGNTMALQNAEVKAKAEATLLSKYGVDNVFKSEEIQNKISEIIYEKYHVHNISQSQYCINKVKETNMRKRGVPCPFQDPVVVAKIRKTLSENGTTPSSKAEKAMCDSLIDLYGQDNCFPSFPFESLTFDCLVSYKDTKIDVEYDGWYWHKDRQKQDMRRNYFVRNRGIKVLRFQAENAVPTKEQLSEAIEELVESSKSLKIIKLDI